MRVVEVADWPAYQDRIAALERGVSYPLGDDRFEIDHGSDYPAFFRRLGELHFFAVEDGADVVAVAAGVLRTVPGPGGPANAFYAADLKVHPAHRGRRLAWRILKHAFPRYYWRCPRGYGITMDPPDRPNRVPSMLAHFWIAPNAPVASLRFWSMDHDAVLRALPTIRRHRGEVSWLSLAGVKDLVLASTGAPMPLLHAQFGPCASPGVADPVAGAVHMLCAPTTDALGDDLGAMGFLSSANATIVAHRMGSWDWSFVLTSDI